MCLLGGFAALGMAVVSAQGDTILFNTDTGQITGNGFAWGTSEYSYTVDSSAQTCTWNFLGDLAIESGTTLQFVGSNRASVQADEVRLGSFNGAAVVINASSYVDGSGNLIQGGRRRARRLGRKQRNRRGWLRQRRRWRKGRSRGLRRHSRR